MSSYIPTKMQKVIEFDDPPVTLDTERAASFLNYAYDNFLQTYIPFNNPSDAMIASLATAYDLPSEHVDLFLSLVRDSDFEGSEVTLRSTTDIYAAIRQHRIRETIRKSDHSINNSSFDNIILCGVIDVLEDDIMHFESLKNKQYLDINEAHDYDLWSTKAREAKQILSLMSQVHPSWTEPARHALGRSISMTRNVSYLENGAEIEMERNALRSPLYGPWTQHLSFSVVDYWGGHRWDYLFHMAQKLTNIRTLSLSFPIRDDETMELALVFVASLESVEELYIEDMSDVANEAILSTLLPRLSRLPRLKKIRLPKTSQRLVEQSLPKDVANCRLSGLLEIQFSLRISSFNPIVTHIAWSRTDVHAKFALFSLVLASRPPAMPSLKNIKNLGRSLPTLSTLALETVSESDTTNLLRECKALRKLSLMSFDFPTTSILENTPKTLHSLSIVFTSENPTSGVVEPYGHVDWDRQLSALLSSKRTPMLRQLRISRIQLNRASPEGESEVMELDLPLTKLVCKTRGIDLDEDLNWKWSGKSFAEAEPED